MQRVRRWICVLGLLVAAPVAAEDLPSVPVTIVTRAELEASGRVTLGEALALLPVNGNGDDHDGSQRLDLRGLGVQRTLVLINGRRMVPGGPGADLAVDLAAIPLVIVERVEVSGPGGATRYGSDAIGGVVNIVTRSQLDGTVTTLYGAAPQRTSVGYSASAITGFDVAGRGHVVIAAGLDHADPIFGADRARDVLGSMLEAPRPDSPSSRYHASSEGSFALSSAVTAFYEASYLRRTSAQPADDQLSGSVVVSKDSLYNPYDGDVYGYRRRLVGLEGQWRQTVDAWRVVAGLRGTIASDAPALGGWAWELSYDHGRTTSTTRGDGILSPSRLAAALGPSFFDGSGVPTCGTPTAPIVGCVPYDILGAEPLTPAVRDYLATRSRSTGSDTQQTVLAWLHGQIATLPDHGALSAAVGADARRERGRFSTDPSLDPGDTQPDAIGAVPDTQHVVEGFAALSLVAVRGKPLAELVSFDLSARAFHYDTSGNGVTWQTGAVYEPIRGLSLRGSYGTAFHAPSVGELYRARGDASQAAEDPCDTMPPSAGGMTIPLSPTAAAVCAQQGVARNASFGTSTIRTVSGGDATAQAETATVITAGAVLAPRQVPGLSIAVDYWHVALADQLHLRSANEILSSCYTRGVQSDCARIHRDPTQGNQVDSIDLALDNSGRRTASGIEGSLGYSIALGAAGQMYGRALVQQVFDHPDPLAVFSGAPDLGGLVKASASSDWSHPSGLGAGATLHYLDDNALESRWYSLDVRASYAFTTTLGKAAVSGGVNNLFDRDPDVPIGATYDPTGRLFYLRGSQQF